jgi:hypothetical protein
LIFEESIEVKAPNISIRTDLQFAKTEHRHHRKEEAEKKKKKGREGEEKDGIHFPPHSKLPITTYISFRTYE